ncbi:MAG: putative glycosyl transferase, partial [Ilumatobacteraceae bacterium]|nr:putative glycosyl transferase [Ilumatobacteraceae bacterium]
MNVRMRPASETRRVRAVLERLRTSIGAKVSLAVRQGEQPRTQTARVGVLSGSAYAFGGMERGHANAGSRIVEAGVLAERVIPQRHNSEELCAWFAAHGSPCAADELLASLNSFGLIKLFAFTRTLRAARFDIVNVHSPGSHIPFVEGLACRLAGLPVIVSVHGYDAAGAPSTATVGRNRLIASYLCRLVVVPSAVVRRQQVQFGVPCGKLRLIRCGVPAVVEHASRSESRRELGFRGDEFVLTSFGRLVPDKGIDVLVRAVELLPDVLLGRLRVCIGGIGDQAGLEACVGERSRHAIRFLGHVNDTEAYYGTADLFVLPSRHEPFGLVFVEAAQHGLA